MKRIISILILLAVVTAGAWAQPQRGDKKGQHGDWREKVRAEQVAFITNELNLTEAEAQVFWPVYNDVQNARREAFHASHEAFKALQDGLDGNDVEKLLDNYLSAKQACEAQEAEAVARYKKVLPADKVARLLLAEEKFRQQQISKLGGQGGPGQGPDQGRGPGHNRGGNFPEKPASHVSL